MPQCREGFLVDNIGSPMLKKVFTEHVQAELWSAGWRRRGYTCKIDPLSGSRWEAKVFESEASRRQIDEEMRHVATPEAPLDRSTEDRIVMALHELPEGAVETFLGWTIMEHPLMGLAEFRGPHGSRYKLRREDFIRRFVETGFFPYSTLLGAADQGSYDGAVPAVPLRPFLPNECLNMVIGTGTDYRTLLIPDETAVLPTTTVYFMEYLQGNRSQCWVMTSSSPAQRVQVHVSRLARREAAPAQQRRPHLVMTPTEPKKQEQVKEEPKVAVPVVQEFDRKLEI
jgi:hypothetical protein